MPYARKDLLIWQKGMYYHIYNRGVNKSTLFREPKNYLFAISKIKEYSLANHLAMIAYCLEPNHYHFLARQDGDEPAGNPATIRIQQLHQSLQQNVPTQRHIV